MRQTVAMLSSQHGKAIRTMAEAIYAKIWPGFSEMRCGRETDGIQSVLARTKARASGLECAKMLECGELSNWSLDRALWVVVVWRCRGIMTLRLWRVRARAMDGVVRFTPLGGNTECLFEILIHGLFYRSSTTTSFVYSITDTIKRCLSSR